MEFLQIFCSGLLAVDDAPILSQKSLFLPEETYLCLKRKATDVLRHAGAPVRKGTSIMTNLDSLVAALQTCQCPKNHVRLKIDGSELRHKMSKWCQVYPEPLVKILAGAA